MKIAIAAGVSWLGIGFLTYVFRQAGSGWIIASTLIMVGICVAIAVIAIRRKRWVAASVLSGWASLMGISLAVKADPKDAVIAIIVTVIVAGVTFWRWSIV